MSAMVVGRSYDEEEDMRKKGETGGGMNRTQALGGTTNWHQVKRDASVLSPPARTDMLTEPRTGIPWLTIRGLPSG